MMGLLVMWECDIYKVCVALDVIIVNYAGLCKFICPRHLKLEGEVICFIMRVLLVVIL